MMKMMCKLSPILIVQMLLLSACQLVLPEVVPVNGEAPRPPAGLENSSSIVKGLNGPQGVLVDDQNNVWVIDSGVGGDEELEFFSPGERGVVTGAFGQSARVIRVTEDGTQTVMAQLPSVVVGREAIGGARLAQLDGVIYATVGQWLAANGPERPPLMPSVVQISEEGMTENGNTWDIESADNPDGFTVDSHPYGITAGPDGQLWIADAGANDILTMDPATGAVTLVAVMDGVPGPFPNATRGDAMEMDPVPTAIAFDAEGNAYVALLPGFPFLPGATKVVKIATDGSMSDYATGLTMLTDLQMAPDGNMYAVQHAIFGEQGPTPNSGAIVKIVEGDGSEVLIDGLPFPTAINFNAAGDAYVAIGGVGPPGSGEVIRVDGLAGAE